MTTPAELYADWKLESEYSIASETNLNTRLLALVNDAYRYIYELEKWSFRRKEQTITTASGTASYALETNFGALDLHAGRIVTSDDNAIAYVDEATWFHRDRDESNQTPVMFTVLYDSASNVYKAHFHPTPDAAYTIYVPQLLKAASLASGDTITFPHGDYVEAMRRDFYLRAYRAFNAKGRFDGRIADVQREWARLLSRVRLLDHLAPDVPNDVYRDVVDQQLTQET